MRRLGGDEFIVTLPGLASEHAAQEAVDIVAQLQAHLTRSVLVPTASITVGASAGFALYPGDGETVTVLMHTADHHMFAAKRARQELVRDRQGAHR